MTKLWMLLLLLACATAPAFAQGDPGNVYTTWTPPSCYAYFVVLPGGSGMTECTEEGWNSNFLTHYEDTSAFANGCVSSQVLTTYSYGEAAYLFGESEVFGSPGDIDIADWLDPDGALVQIILGADTVEYCGPDWNLLVGMVYVYFHSF